MQDPNLSMGGERSNRPWIIGWRMVPTREMGEVVRGFRSCKAAGAHLESRRGLEAAFRKVAFSSRKAKLAAKNDANYYWWDSC